MFRPLHVSGPSRGSGKEHSLKRIPRLAIAAGTVCAAVMALTSAVATAAPPPTVSAQALAAQAADAFVSAAPAAVHASADEQFVQLDVISSEGWQYVPYERTYQGLPVLGGDFVVVVDKTGAVSNLSV